jgi:hypothetical protein
MTIISIKDNFPEVAAQLKRLSDDVSNKALVRSLNRTIDQGRTQMARTISQEFRVTVGTAKEALNVKKARAGNLVVLSAELVATSPRSRGRGLNLIRFVVKEPTRNKKGKLGQVMFQVKRKGGRKYIKGAFIATSRKTRGRALFVRLSKDSMPIETKTTVDIPQMFNTKRINADVVQVMRDRFEINFNRELNVVMQGYLK